MGIEKLETKIIQGYLQNKDESLTTKYNMLVSDGYKFFLIQDQFGIAQSENDEMRLVCPTLEMVIKKSVSLKTCDCCGSDFDGMDGYFMNQHGDVYDTLDCAEQDNGPQEPTEWDDNDNETDWSIFWTQDDDSDDEQEISESDLQEWRTYTAR